MGNLSAFDPVLPAQKPAPARDADGFLIPPLWQAVPDRWARLPFSMRQRRGAEYEAELANAQPEKAKSPRRYAKRFTTAAAIKWGRSKGWKLIDREHTSYERNQRRHHDLMLGVDALFDSPEGMVGVQGAGRYERREHYERFVQRGGPEKAERRHIRVVYVEFERGKADPILEEWWT